MEPKPCGGLEGQSLRLNPIDPFGSIKDACRQMGAKTGIEVEPSHHPTVPGLVVLRALPKKPERPPESPAEEPEPRQVSGPDHAARLALIEKIDRLLAYEKRIAELLAQNRALEDIVARLAAENRDLRKPEPTTRREPEGP